MRAKTRELRPTQAASLSIIVLFLIWSPMQSGPAVSDQDQLFTAICEILNLHSNIQSQSVRHFFSVHKNCQFVFCCTAEFYFTQKIKCQSLPNSGRHQIHGCKSRTFLLSTLFSLTLDVFGTGTVVGALGKKGSKCSKHAKWLPFFCILNRLTIYLNAHCSVPNTSTGWKSLFVSLPTTVFILSLARG